MRYNVWCAAPGANIKCCVKRSCCSGCSPRETGPRVCADKEIKGFGAIGSSTRSRQCIRLSRAFDFFPWFTLARMEHGGYQAVSHSFGTGFNALWQRVYTPIFRRRYYSRLTFNTRPSRGYSRFPRVLDTSYSTAPRVSTLAEHSCSCRTARFYDHTQDHFAGRYPRRQQCLHPWTRKEEDRNDAEEEIFQVLRCNVL